MMIRNEFPEAEYQVLSEICEDNQVKEEISTTSCSFSYPESIIGKPEFQIISETRQELI